MPTLVAPDVVRYAIEGKCLDQPAFNILDFVVHTAEAGPSRSDYIKTVGKALADNWYDLTRRVSTSYQCNAIHYTDLDAVDGDVGDISGGNDHPFPFTGGVQQSSEPSNLAIRIDKLTTGGRGTRKGRFYMAGVPPTTRSGNNLVGNDQVTTQTAADAFLSAMTETEVIGDGNYFLTVIHHKQGVYSGNTQVTGLTVRTRLSSQSQRLTLP